MLALIAFVLMLLTGSNVEAALIVAGFLLLIGFAVQMLSHSSLLTIIIVMLTFGIYGRDE